MLIRLGLSLFLAMAGVGIADAQRATGVIQRETWKDPFRQLEEVLPTPNDFRTASGAPGPAYWQQSVDYQIDVTLDENERSITGQAEVAYTNRSPDPLEYLWLQLDANIHAPDADARSTQTTEIGDSISLEQLRREIARGKFDGSMKIRTLKQVPSGVDLPFTIVKTMMRIDLPQPLPPGETFRFQVGWYYRINDSSMFRGRSGFEHFAADDNCIFELAQWYPRACAYTDVNGWQHKQFLGAGEFTLEFGNYSVNITVPEDHVVASTGELQNPEEVLLPEWRERLAEAVNSPAPRFIVTPAEAAERQKSRLTGTRTWRFEAEQVRDFAFASSRKFIWDAMGCPLGGRTVMAMSFYPNEGEPLWSRYSTHAVAHTLEVYSRMTFDYPYPVAISVNGPVGGMEYPMICFNGPRPEPDGTYPARTKYGLISVVIHEVGHNWFPMIVNSDERQWTWMDEGLNTFLQFVAEQEWEPDYPSRRGEPALIADYMRSDNQVPVMTNSESLVQFGENAYAKPATALNILRESVLGRELFDFAFRQYAQRWKFKRPQPADFFRTMEDASGVDLDWFWRGWFYSTDAVDVSVEEVRRLTLDTGAGYLEKPRKQGQEMQRPRTLTEERNAGQDRRTDRFPELRDFYNEFDPLQVTDDDREEYEKLLKQIDETQLDLFSNPPMVWIVTFANRGGLVAPLTVQLEFEDGSTEIHRIPAEIWRVNHQQVNRMFLTSRAIRKVVLDPQLESADVDTTNNVFPRQIGEKEIRLRTGPPEERERGPNPMRELLEKNRQPEPAGDGGAPSPADQTGPPAEASPPGRGGSGGS